MMREAMVEAAVNGVAQAEVEEDMGVEVVVGPVMEAAEVVAGPAMEAAVVVVKLRPVRLRLPPRPHARRLLLLLRLLQ